MITAERINPGGFAEILFENTSYRNISFSKCQNGISEFIILFLPYRNSS